MYFKVLMYLNGWSLGGVRGSKAGNALQEVCVCMKWGTVVALFGLAAGFVFLLFWVPGLCLDGNRPGCAWTRAAEGAWTQNE